MSELKTFRYSGAQSWNKLPTHVRKSQNKNCYKTECVKYIKTIMYDLMILTCFNCM